ncbi:uracil-DNA glycosylase family protein [Aureimonas ureilytica]|uniref:uracil-DNA glycosylase family protein n=1 Tax=Aureimonas ureilytica TaxID=401562 RepID=UPI0007345147|nr:uracil-DNA glycosylase family protein [Aureimonas ureilytica]
MIDGSTTSGRHSVDAIVERLAELPGKADLFNPYAGFDAEIEDADAPATRCRNLQRYLAGMADRGVSDLWLGEAPSRFGARRTGVPFTGDGRLADLSQRLGVVPPLARATRETLPTRESGTSREIWNAMPASLPLFWNAVLFHPHRGVLPLRNRTPTWTEIAAHREVLAMIVAIFAPRRILCIGRVAQRAADGLGIPTTYVRHPAQGGAVRFRAGVAAFLDNRPPAAAPPSLSRP